MSFKKNTAVTGFIFGLVSATDGSAITTGTVTGYYTLDGGTQGTIAGSAVHEGNGQWSINLLAAEMNGDIVGLIFTHASAINASFTIKTDTKIVSELQDLTAAQVNTEVDSGISDAALATAANLATVDTNVDAVLVDTGTTIPAQITALNDFDPASDTVANVTLVATTTTNTDMRGTDNAALASALAVVDTIVDGILVDTGTTIPAQLDDMSGATFNTATDSLEAIRDRGDTSWLTGAGGSSPTVEQIRTEMDSNSTQLAAIVLDTGTTIPAQLDSMSGATFNTLTDSLEAIRDRGDSAWTTGAGGSSPTVEQIRAEMDSNSTQLAAIVADTNELQTNQGNWLTATGFATTNPDNASIAAILTDTGSSIPSQITALNDIAATDIVSNGAITTLAGAVVNVDLVDTTTTNTDMRGTDSANTTAPDNASIASILTDTGTTIPALIAALNNVSTADILASGDVDGYSIEESLKILMAALAGVLAGAATSSITIRAVDGSKTRITATVDSNGNRTITTLDAAD